VDRPRPPHNAPFASYKVSRASTALHHATALPSSERYRMRSAARNQLLTHLRPLKRNPHTGHLFVFRGRRGSLIKLLWHDGQGRCLFAPAGARVWLATGHTDMRKGFDGLASPAPAAATRSSAPLALHQGPDQRRHRRTAQPLDHRDQRRHIGGSPAISSAFAAFVGAQTAGASRCSDVAPAVPALAADGADCSYPIRLCRVLHLHRKLAPYDEKWSGNGVGRSNRHCTSNDGGSRVARIRQG
jgi:transposase